MGVLPWEESEIRQLTWRDAMIIQNHRDNTFRLVVFILSLSIGILTYAHNHARYAVIATCCVLITITLAYAIQVLVVTTRVLRRIPGYSAFATSFYYIATSLLTLMFVFLIIRVDWHYLVSNKRLRVHRVSPV